MDYFQHSRFQHPVGQGGFHSATVRVAGQTLTYVYDCGAISSKALDREIKIYAESNVHSNRIDICFLSHLDFDHVSGLERLLSRTPASHIILPYLSSIERLFVFAKAIESGVDDDGYAQLIGDPVGWFRDHGATQITFVEGDDDPDGGAVVLPDDLGPFPSREGSNQNKMAGENLHFELDIRKFNASLKGKTTDSDSVSSSTPGVSTMSHKTSLPLYLGPRLLNWVFATHVYPAGSKIALFKDRVEKRFPEAPISRQRLDGEFASWLQVVLRSSTKRKQLRKCYEAIEGNHNLTSMSLYSGPIRSFGSAAFLYAREKLSDQVHALFHSLCKVGWVGTGDADLKTRRRREAFRGHFARLLDNVMTFSLPHHGARRNFNRELLEWGELFLVSARSDNRHHPHASVVQAIKEISAHFVHVSEGESSGLREIVLSA